MYMAPENVDFRPSPVPEVAVEDDVFEEAYMAPERMVGLHQHQHQHHRNQPRSQSVPAEDLYMNPEQAVLAAAGGGGAHAVHAEDLYMNPEQAVLAGGGGGHQHQHQQSVRRREHRVASESNYAVEVWSSDEGGDSDCEERPTSLFERNLCDSVDADSGGDSTAAAPPRMRARSSSLDGVSSNVNAEDLYMAPETALANFHGEHPYEDAYMSPESLDLHASEA